jgi:ABC-type uncharacterized transport system substrate-binding protein
LDACFTLNVRPGALGVQALDRILKGEQPGDLPVQSLDNSSWSFNLKTAKALGMSRYATLCCCWLMS